MRILLGDDVMTDPRASSGDVETAAPARSARPWLLLAAALLLALAVGGAALALSRLVDPPIPLDSSEVQLAYGLDGDIYLASADGQNPVRIADGEAVGEDGELLHCSTLGGEGPMWSPDGRYVAYRSQSGDACEGIVYLSDAEGQPVASFPGTGWDISWSPDSTRVATWLELFETVGIYGIDGELQTALSASSCVVSGDYDPLWSPDGQSVVVAGCEMPIDGQTPRLLSEDDPRSRLDWVYSPDKARVAYKTYTEDSASVRTASLVIAEADGTELQILTHQSDWNDPTTEVVYFGDIVWSPLGDHVAFTWMTSTLDDSPVASELRVLDISSGDETTIAAAIATEPGIGGPLAYSPGGDRILFSKDVDGAMGLWSITAEGSDAHLLVTGSDWGDWQPLAPRS